MYPSTFKVVMDDSVLCSQGYFFGLLKAVGADALVWRLASVVQVHCVPHVLVLFHCFLFIVLISVNVIELC